MTSLKIVPRRAVCIINILILIVATLEYGKACARWVPRMLTQEHKERRMQVCQELLNQYEAEGDSFLDRIISGDETWCHHYEPQAKRQSKEWRHVNSPSKKKFRRCRQRVKGCALSFGIGEG